MTISLLYATIASLCWTIAPLIGAPAARELGSLHFTRIRTSLAAIVFGIVATVSGSLWHVPSEAIVYLLGSSFIGIAVGDFLLFHSLKLIGARRSSILYSFNIPWTALLAFLFLGERITIVQMCGFVVTGIGIAIAIAFKASTSTSEIVKNQDFRIGVAAGMGAALAQAVGLILAKPAFATGIGVDAAAGIRLMAAAAVLHVPLLFSGRMTDLVPKVRFETIARTAAAALIGTGLGVFFLMLSLSQGKTSLTSLFSSLSPIFMLPVMALLGNDRPRLLAWFGGIAACIGLGLLLCQPALGATVKVAVIYPLTGKDADFGCITRSLALRQANRQHRYMVDQFDNSQDAIETSNLVTKMIATQPLGVIGTHTSQEAIVASTKLNHAEIPFIAPIASHPDVTRDRPWTLRIVGDSSHYAELWSKYTVERIKAKRVVIVTNVSLPYSVGYTSMYRNDVKKRASDTEIIDIEVIDGFDAFDSLAAKIVAAKADVLFIAMYAQHVVPLFDALVKIKAKISILSTGGMNDGSAIMAKMQSTANAIPFLFNGVWSGKLHGPSAGIYRALMRTACSSQQDTMRTVLAFDAMNAFVSAAESMKEPSRSALIKALRRPGRRVGVSGSYEITSAGETLRPLEIFSIERQGIRHVGSYE